MSFQIGQAIQDSQSGKTGSSGDSDGEDFDESSSSGEKELNVEDVLSSFREKWQKELKTSPTKKKQNQTSAEHESDYESKARTLFLRGVDKERNGELYEAIQFYRRAVQLVPDIEFRLSNFPMNTPIVYVERKLDAEDDKVIDDISDEDSDRDGSDDDEIKEGELLPRIQKKQANKACFCIPKNEQKAIHISALPMEMMLYILKWVVSNDLDLRSLEMFSQVCRGFYLCARDPEIWKLACLRVWGLNCGSCPLNFVSWRHMFIERPRLQFNGCYISKITYLRHGENSFQDQFYRPWHLVAYYRFVRFFPEGVVLVLTSSEEPASSVGLLKSRNIRTSGGTILRGFYRLKDDKVTLVAQRTQDNKHLSTFKKPKRRGGDAFESAEQTFHMELQIKSTQKKRHMQLVWTHYSVSSRTAKGDESTCNFDLANSKFPPFWFSRVRSYTSESESPLQ